MARRTPNPHSPEEVRRAFQRVQFDTAIITEGAVGEVLVGAGTGTAPAWTTELTTLTLLTVDNITINAATIISDTGAISFGNENLTTTGSYTGINVTSGNDPGHTHSIYSLVDGTRPFTGVVGGVTPVDNADLATKLYVDTAVAGAVPQTSAEIDDDGAQGQPVYMAATGHVDLAHADSSITYLAVGLLNDDYSSGETATFQVQGLFELADWTTIIGTASLTAGKQYYLEIYTLAGDTPDYANPGGTGDRQGTIAVAVTVSGTFTSIYGTADPEDFVDSYTTDPHPVFQIDGSVVAGQYFRFDFGIGEDKHITEAIWYQGSAATFGTWKWQGSDNGTAWTDIGSAFLLGGSTAQTQTELSGNGSGYRYYQLVAVVPSVFYQPWFYEIDFKIDDYSAGKPKGMLTKTPPSASGNYILPVGRAVSVTTMDIEIGQPILLR